MGKFEGNYVIIRWERDEISLPRNGRKSLYTKPENRESLKQDLI